jgi:hypothetical protein
MPNPFSIYQTYRFMGEGSEEAAPPIMDVVFTIDQG